MMPGQIHFRDHFDDARAADAGDARGGHRRIEARLIGPQLRADHPEARLKRYGVDADALDGARCGALAAGNLRPFKGRPRGRRAGQQPCLGAQDDFRIGADIDGENDFVGILRRFRQHHARRIGADMARDAGQHIALRPGIEFQVKLAGRAGDGKARGQRKGRAAKLRGINAEEQVVHHRIADEDDFQNIR